MKWLIFGAKTGWVGGMVCKLLEDSGETVFKAESRLLDCEKEITEIAPDRVINAAGLTGRPNICWLEDHKLECVQTNVLGLLNLLEVCHKLHVHVTNFATGCIYEYDEKHVIGGLPFTELDPPNFFGSYYSLTKAYVEELAKPYDPLWLRLRMPLTPDDHPRNFITKIRSYEKVVDIPNSMSVLEELLPAAILLAGDGTRGIFNFTNPGAISHNEVLQMYKEKVDPTFTWKNFSLLEQSKILKAGRSNTELDASKLMTVVGGRVVIRPIKEAVCKLFESYTSLYSC